MSGATDSLVVDLADGLQLMVLVDLGDSRSNSAAIYRGRYPDGKRLALTVFDRSKARVDVENGNASLWLGATLFDLPWLELLKVADFLRLPIDVPPTEVVEVKS